MIEQVGPLTLLADAAGGHTAYIDNRAAGRVVAIKFVAGNIVATSSLTITGETSTCHVLVDTSTGTGTTWYYPMQIATVAGTPAGVGTGTDSAITEVPVFVLGERIKVVLAGATAAQTGTITFFIDQQH